MKEQLPLLLILETASKNCSVALSRGAELLAFKETADQSYSHAENLHVFIKEVLDQAGFKPSDLSAVAVSLGPGSYTGLRIGMSAAKGLCYALDLPLISFSPLASLASGLTQTEKIEEDEEILALLDARRMEAFAQYFSHRARPKTEIVAQIFTEETAANLADKGVQVWLAGDAQEKLKDLLGDTVRYSEITYPSARFVCEIVHEKFMSEDFENLAYVEPFYMKEYIAGKPKKPLI